MKKYDPSKIESKWQRYWEKGKSYETRDLVAAKENFMLLTEFPYPSGDLHIGHWYAFSLPDILARYLRRKGKNVLYPIGFDAFGLPAENAAIKRNINPREWTEKNIKYMTKQLQSMGATFDWSREVRTIDPGYYKWTQWIFLKMFEKGLAYRAKTKANWCPKDKTVLANEQVVDGCCERCGSIVEQREIEQWMFKITAYAEKLLAGLDEVDWDETIKTAQRNWIGRSEGAIVSFEIKNPQIQKETKPVIKIFTTRLDTIFGATFLVISPEMAQRWIQSGGRASQEVLDYINASFKKTELERQENREKTGVDTGIKVTNPASKDEIPVWVSDYVLGGYGTGAIMAVPAYDERDREFADKFNLPIKEVPLENLQEIIKKFEEEKIGKVHATYRLRDWLLSRQRYWGVPIPVINCPKCGYQPVLENNLPVELPKLDDYKPSDDGRSPLAKASKWLKVKCPKCGGQAERETDTMDTFVDSSWYFMRYADPRNKDIFASKEKMAKWLPVPLYIGGSEHNTMHLLYSRFFTKVLHDLGYIEFDEPYLRRINRGFILGPDHQKMSKSRGNVVDPDVEVAKYGADTVRMYLAFMGPYEQGGPWNPDAISGVFRFLNRIWNFFHQEASGEDGEGIGLALNKAIKAISRDIESLSFNTGVSELMKLLNEFEKVGVAQETRKNYIRLLAPFAPHLAEEIWQEVFGEKSSVHSEIWPEYDQKLLNHEGVNLVVQINGKMRGLIKVKRGLTEGEAKDMAMADDKIKAYLEGKDIKKIIYVEDKLINIVIN